MFHVIDKQKTQLLTTVINLQTNQCYNQIRLTSYVDSWAMLIF